jgi:hypothetical protein
MRGRCPSSKYGFHESTVIGDPWSEMTFYSCRLCGQKRERGQGTFYGQEKPVRKTTEQRLIDIEKKIDSL